MSDMATANQSLLDELKMASATAIDFLREISERAGADCEVSIVISHPDTAEDSFIVGQHDMDRLFAILTRISTGTSVASDVSATFVGKDEPIVGAGIQ
jgi:hypothetical protein